MNILNSMCVRLIKFSALEVKAADDGTYPTSSGIHSASRKAATSEQVNTPLTYLQGVWQTLQQS